MYQSKHHHHQQQQGHGASSSSSFHSQPPPPHFLPMGPAVRVLLKATGQREAFAAPPPLLLLLLLQQAAAAALAAQLLPSQGPSPPALTVQPTLVAAQEGTNCSTEPMVPLTSLLAKLGPLRWQRDRRHRHLSLAAHHQPRQGVAVHPERRVLLRTLATLWTATTLAAACGCGAEHSPFWSTPPLHRQPLTPQLGEHGHTPSFLSSLSFSLLGCMGVSLCSLATLTLCMA